MRISSDMALRPDVSIIMAVKNGEATLNAALDSIFNQSFSNWELIVINDGSTDATSVILEKFRKKLPHKVFVYEQENMGLTKSLNKAILLSRGKFLARMDADDLSLPRRLELQMMALKEQELDFCVTRALKDGKIVPGVFLFLNASTHLLKFDNFFVHGSFFGKREVFEHLMYNENFRFAQDYDFALRLLKNKYKLGYLFSPQYVLGTSPDQISIKKAKVQRDISRKIALEHYNSAILNFYWSLGQGSLLRKISKLVLGCMSLRKMDIKKCI